MGFEYKVERKLSTVEGDEESPDIVGSGASGWCVIEVTLRDKSKAPIMAKYSKLDGLFLSTHGLTVHRSVPDVMTSRLEFIDDGDYCQLLVKDEFEARKVERLRNEELRVALSETNRFNLELLPPIPISFVPEMAASPDEIRNGLVDIVMQIFEPSGEGKSLQEIVKDGLERLVDKITDGGRQMLTEAVRKQMDSLVRGPLRDYLTYENGKYRPTDRWKRHHGNMEFISKKLCEWAVKVTTLDDFSATTKS
ncbi:MAG: hypothetical protein QXT68_07295 [Halobacteria archaeon]